MSTDGFQLHETCEPHSGRAYFAGEKMNHALEAVFDYVNMRGTDHALLINGPWGCGKTYFWNHAVVPRLQELTGKRRKRRVLYASLYGVENTRSIDTQLLLESFSDRVPKKLRCLAAGAGNIAKALPKKCQGFDLSGLDIRWLLRARDAILCLDDLERCKMPMEETLGYINHFVEHCHAKVILLCNEDEISDDERRSTYQKMKEKVVGFTVSYQADPSEVLDSLRESYKQEKGFYQFLSDSRKDIHDLFNRSGTNNLRALQRAVSALSAVFDVVAGGGIAIAEVSKPLLFAAVPSALELYGRGIPAGELKKAHDSKMIAVAMATFRESDAEPSYDEKYARRYFLNHPDWRYARGCLPICDYLEKGYLDKTALLDWVKELLPDESPKGIRSRFLLDSREMADRDFRNQAAQILKDVNDGQIADAVEYAQLFNHFYWCVEEELVSVSAEEVFEIFKGGLEKSVQEYRFQANDDLDLVLVHMERLRGNKLAEAFQAELLRANREAQQLDRKERVVAVVSEMKTDPVRFINTLMSEDDSDLRYTAVFDHLDPTETVDWIVSLSNAHKEHLRVALLGRYDVSTPEKYFGSELPALKQITDGLVERLKTLAPPEEFRITRWNLDRLVKVLNTVRARLEGAGV